MIEAGLSGFYHLRVQGMDLVQIRKEIEEKAKGHRKAEIPPVRMAEFEGLSGKEFLDKAYCRLLGRMPGTEEKEGLYLRFYSGDVSKGELLEGLASSEECAVYGVDVADVLEGCSHIRDAEGRRNSFFGRIGRMVSLLKYLFTHKAAWRRLERIQEIWEQEDKA